MALPAFGFFQSRLFLVWLGLVALCLAATLFVRFQVAEKIRSFVEDGTVQFSTDPTGAQVLLDGKGIGTTPFSRRLQAGTYHFIFQRGNWSLPRDVTVKARETSQASVKFNYATASFTSQPDGVDIILDGAKIGTTSDYVVLIAPVAMSSSMR